MRMRRKRKIFKLRIGLFTILLIAITTVFILNIFNKGINTRIGEIVQSKVNRIVDKIILTNVDKNIYKTNYDDLIDLLKNEDGEIISVEFKMDKAYEIVSKTINDIKNEVQFLNNGKLNYVYYDDSDLTRWANGYIFEIAAGNMSTNFFYSNLGPKIPVQIFMANGVLANLRTDVSDYGINNVLVEVYIDFEITTEIMTVHMETIKKEYSVLIASKVIAGKVPDIFGNSIQKNTPIVSG